MKEYFDALANAWNLNEIERNNIMTGDYPYWATTGTTNASSNWISVVNGYLLNNAVNQDFEFLKNELAKLKEIMYPVAIVFCKYCGQPTANYDPCHQCGGAPV